MKHLISILSLILLLLGCKPQMKSKDYYFSQVGWTISVSKDFEIMDSLQIQKLNKKGRDAIENTLDTTVDFSATKTLISITKNRSNNFAATLTPFNPKEDGDWIEQNESLKQIMVETFKNQVPNAKIDTSSRVDTIKGINFQVFEIELTLPNKTLLKTSMYSTLYKGFDFGITITYVDTEIGEKLKNILLSSSFTN